MIEVCDLTKDYGQRRAISNLNFQIKKGEVVGFLGPNGAGKSTTMKIITGYMAPTSGIAKIAGIDVFENPIEVKKRIGYLPETPPVYGDMYVQDYLKYVAELKCVDPKKIKILVDRAIEKTHLTHVSHRLIQNLSKGFRQRVGIAQALVSDPEVLVLDEPTVGLDPKQVSEIRELINELKGQHTIILSTHILSEVQATCEKAIIINKGKIVAEDSIEKLEQLEKGRSRILLKIKNAADLAKDMVRVSGILNVKNEFQNKHWIIDTNGTEQSLEEISSFIVNKGYGLLELTPQKIDLEDVFIKLTYGESGGEL